LQCSYNVAQSISCCIRISHKDLEYKMCQGCDWSWSWYSFSFFQCARDLGMRFTSTEPDSKYTHSLTSQSGCSGSANFSRNISLDIGMRQPPDLHHRQDWMGRSTVAHFNTRKAFPVVLWEINGLRNSSFTLYNLQFQCQEAE